MDIQMNKKILKWIIYTGLFLIPFVPFLVFSPLFFPFITSKAFTFRIIIEIIFGAWLILAALDPVYRPKKSIILYSLVAFLFIIGLADIFGIAPTKSFWSNFERMEGFIALLHLGGFFIIIASMFKERDPAGGSGASWKWWWNTTLSASAIMVLYSLFQIAGVVTINQGGVRVDGTFGNAAYLAVYMLFHIFLAMMMFAQEKRGNFLRWVYGALILGQVIILYYTATRGAILGLLGGLLLVALLNLRNKENREIQKTSLIGVAIFVVLVSGFLLARNSTFVKSSAVLSRFSSLSLAEIKTEGRSFVWPIAIEGIKERPILGWGQENFNYVFNTHYSPEMFRLEPWFDRAHNIFLDWGIAGGLLGLLAYLSLYLALLVSIWRRSEELSYVERTILTGLIAAYFFHNLFVFDHLISYILFFSLLGYVHTRTHKQSEWGVSLGTQQVLYYLAPAVVILLGFGIYKLNIQPIIANRNLILALQTYQSSDTNKLQAANYFRSAYNESRLGRPEVVEWIVSSADTILGSSMSVQEKNDYFIFAKEAVEKQVKDLRDDARYELIAGTFFAETGYSEEALSHFNRAKELTPGKQMVYIQLGSALINSGDTAGALANFKTAYDMAPDYLDAKIIYLAGAIYANDRNVADKLISEISENDLVSDDRIISALSNTGNYPALIELLKRRVVLRPNDPQSYISLATTYVKAGNSTQAIEVLRIFEDKLPQYKTQIDEYIKGILDGSVK